MRTGVWSPWRRIVALLAVLVAALTGVAASAVGGSSLYGATLYLAATVLAILSPGLIVVQVIAGQLVVAGALIGPAEVELVALLPLAAGLVASAELLGVAARLDMPVERHPASDFQRVAVTALVGAGAFGAVMWAAELPGPSGLLAVALASGALVLAAAALVWRARG